MLSCAASGVAVVSLVSVEVQRLTVCPPARRVWCIVCLCICCIVCFGVGQINGNAPVKLCKRFWCFGGIAAFMVQKLLQTLVCSRYAAGQKEKPCTLSRCKAKKSPATRRAYILDFAGFNRCTTPGFFAGGGVVQTVNIGIRIVL